MLSSAMIEVLAASLVTGLVSATATVAAIRVHINYIRETLQRHERDLLALHVAVEQIRSECWARQVRIGEAEKEKALLQG